MEGPPQEIFIQEDQAQQNIQKKQAIKGFMGNVLA